MKKLVIVGLSTFCLTIASSSATALAAPSNSNPHHDRAYWESVVEQRIDNVTRFDKVSRSHDDSAIDVNRDFLRDNHGESECLADISRDTEHMRDIFSDVRSDNDAVLHNLRDLRENLDHMSPDQIQDRMKSIDAMVDDAHSDQDHFSKVQSDALKDRTNFSDNNCEEEDN